MTKMIKMSLIAAVAVTGMTSVASAQNLEDAIKGVDFSGNVRYRYTNGEVNAVEGNEYRLEMTVKSKVNDMVTATVSTGLKAATKTADADPSGADIKEANFAFALPVATVIAGKQALATPFASGKLEDQQGTGVVALVPVADVTVAAGLFLNSDAKVAAKSHVLAPLGAEHNNYKNGVDLGDNNIGALAVIGKVAMVDYAAWYAKVSEHTNNTTGATATTIGAVNNAGATAINLNAKAPVGPVNVEVNYASVNYTGTVGDLLNDQKQSRIVVSGKVDAVTLAAGYVKAGKDGGDVTLGDNDSSANFKMEEFSATALKNTTALYLAAKAPVGPVTVGLEHGRTSDVDGQTAGDVKFSETKLSVAYAMSKNFTVSGFVTETAGDGDFAKKGQNRIEVLYKF